jgi:ATP-dependent DNA helicase RecG
LNIQELKQLASSGESERLEFKRTTGQRSEATKSICGMLNGTGGVVLFGVTDKREIRGQKISAKTIEDIVAEHRRIEPPVFPEILTITLDDGNQVIAILVHAGGGPYTYNGRPYIRYGPVTTVMPKEQYEKLLLEQMHASRRWENQPSEGLGIQDIDHTRLVSVVEESIRRQRLEDPGTRDPKDLLTGLGLFHEGHLLNAAVVLFGKSERLLPSYTQCLIRMARFRGTDTSEFIDNRQEMGNAFELLQRAQRFLRDHLPVAGRILPTVFERVDDPLYPPAALREALANALCHRDYSIGGGAVTIAVFDDRLEISSTGDLHFGITPEDLLRPHRSRPWNPLIAQTFYRCGIIEAWGRGTLKMAELMEQAGLPAPEIETAAGELYIRFRPFKKPSQVKGRHSLSLLQQELISLLSDSESVSLAHILKRLSEPRASRTVQENLAALRKLGLVQISGRGRNAEWFFSPQ